MKLITGNSNSTIAKGISEYLNTELTNATITRFADGEIFVEINDNMRGEDVFVIQSTSFPANDNMMELLIMLDALKRSSARRITAVIPYYGYARQDRKPGPRTPISAKLVADILTTAGADRVLTVDLHAGQIQGFFNIPVDNMQAAPVFRSDINKNYKQADVAVVSPDVGGVVRARAIAKKIDASLAIIDKRREKAGISEVINIIGEVSGKDCIIVDDIVDSAGTLCNAANAIMEKGASSVSAYITHGVLSGKALERIENSSLKELVVTDSIAPTGAMLKVKNIRVLSIAPLVAEAIKRISDETSVSCLFD